MSSESIRLTDRLKILLISSTDQQKWTIKVQATNMGTACVLQKVEF